MKKWGWLIIIMLVALTACAESEAVVREEKPDRPQTVAAAPSAPGEVVIEEFVAYIEETQELDNIPGVAVALVHEDEIVLAEGFGWRDVEAGEPVTPETLFHIGSTQKSMTSLLVATLVEEGRFGWDTPVQQIYPDFSLSDPASAEAVTLRDLLNMSSGIPDEAEDALDFHEDSPAGVFDAAAETPLLGPPGEAFSYSNLAYAVAGYLAAIEASGPDSDLYESYALLLQERVLDPLNMDSATLSARGARASEHYAKPYFLNDEGELEEAPSEDVEGDPLAPAGALKASVRDMARYIGLYVNEGESLDGTRLISPETVRVLRQPHLEDYGLGWETVEAEGLLLVMHEGSYNNFISVIGYLPDRDVGFVILSNSADAAELLISEAPYVLAELLAEE